MGTTSVDIRDNRQAKGVGLLDEVQRTFDYDGELVQFVRAGSAVQGAFHCADCGYGVSVQTTLPRCPMCAGTSWERVLRGGPWATATGAEASS